MLAYPTASFNWQGGYEDVGEARPYFNLTQWEPEVVIAFLCRNKDRNPQYVPQAKKLLRFVEDQFVLFGPQSEAHAAPVKGPLVFEQYVCWWPMEVHAGYYLLANLELHKATGEQVYLDKAKATGNAICAAVPRRFDFELGLAMAGKRQAQGRKQRPQLVQLQCHRRLFAVPARRLLPGHDRPHRRNRNRPVSVVSRG